MIKNRARMSVIILSVFTIIAIATAVFVKMHNARDMKSSRTNIISVDMLNSNVSIVGEWEQMDSDVISWRIFTENGSAINRKDDLMSFGTYETKDKHLIISYGKPGLGEKWNFGFLEDKLILINETRGEVEEYYRVPNGTKTKEYENFSSELKKNK